MRRVQALLGVLTIACAGGAPSSAPSASSGRQPTQSLVECSPAPPDQVAPIDVAIAIDVSASTAAPSGFDVNANGQPGEQPRNKIFPTASDPGDSILAAQVAAARHLVAHYAGGNSRFSLIAYSGRNPHDPSRRASDSFVESQLSTDPLALDAALDRVQAHGSRGAKLFSAGMTAAIETLTAAAPANSRKVVLFISESAYPIVLSSKDDPQRADPRMQTAAQSAIDAKIVFHTFGVGEAASTQEPHTLSWIAGATGGKYHPVADARQLGCSVASALAP